MELQGIWTKAGKVRGGNCEVIEILKLKQKLM